MTKDEMLLRELCKEIVSVGTHSNRFTELWIESGVNLTGVEFDIANQIMINADLMTCSLSEKKATVH